MSNKNPETHIVARELDADFVRKSFFSGLFQCPCIMCCMTVFFKDDCESKEITLKIISF